jgi:hypothetical protein
MLIHMMYINWISRRAFAYTKGWGEGDQNEEQREEGGKEGRGEWD